MSGTGTVYQQCEHLHTVGLTAAADRLASALEAAERDKPPYTEFLHDMLTHEVAALHQHRPAERLRFAKLPARKRLEQFDHAAQPSLDRRLSTISRHCGSSRSTPTCCSSAYPASGRRCSPPRTTIAAWSRSS